MPTIPPQPFTYTAHVLDVHDGDTYRLQIDLGFRVAVDIQARVRDINCPELNTPEGIAARNYAYQLLAGNFVTVRSYRDRRSFARWVCDIWLGDRLVADLLIGEGHAAADPHP